MMIIDSHAHIFPKKIAEKASKNIGAFYDLPMSFNGSTDSLLTSCDKAGVTKCVVHSVATKKEQVESINKFILSSVNEYPDKFIGFCSLHPDMSQNEADEEIKNAILLGFKGIKLHPDFQKFNIDDKHAFELYEAIDNRLPILIHAGDKRFGYSSPVRLSAAAKYFHKQRFVAAHFGGYTEWYKASKCLADLDNVWVDSSSTLEFISSEKADEYVRAYTPDRIFFGTDYPMWTAENEIKNINSLTLDDEEREKIFYKNISIFLGLQEFG